MAEAKLYQALEELQKRQFQQFDNAEEHIFSEKHQKAMEKIFSSLDEKLKDKNDKK